jgi:hypothetical protein
MKCVACVGVGGAAAVAAQLETATFPDTGRGFGEFRERCPTGQAVISHGHNLRQARLDM